MFLLYISHKYAKLIINMVLTADLEFRIYIRSMRGKREIWTRGRDVIYKEQKANDGGGR